MRAVTIRDGCRFATASKIKLNLIIANDQLPTTVKKASILDVVGILDARLIDDSFFDSARALIFYKQFNFKEKYSF